MRPGDGMGESDLERVEKFAEAIQAAADRHGVTHTEDWHPEAYAAMALADKEHARLIAEVEALRRVVRRSGESLREADEDRAEVAEYRAKKFAPMSRIHRAERVAENAVADKRAAEAERDRLRISPDRLEEMLGIDPNDPLNKLARYGVEQRRRAEDAEAEVVRHRTLHESIRARANVALVAERAKLAGALDKVRKFAEDVRSHPPVTPTTTGEEMLSVRLQRWFADDLEAILDECEVLNAHHRVEERTE